LRNVGAVPRIALRRGGGDDDAVLLLARDLLQARPGHRVVGLVDGLAVRTLRARGDVEGLLVHGAVRVDDVGERVALGGPRPADDVRARYVLVKPVLAGDHHRDEVLFQHPDSTRKDSPGPSLIGPKVSPSIQPLSVVKPMPDFAVVSQVEGTAAFELR